jgi:hypothetical protein
MFICVAVLNVIRRIFDFIIELVEFVIQTVCGWVSTVLHFARSVCEEVCGWLGPFSFLCDWVCTIIRWTETVWNWVCEEILVPIVVGFIRIVFEVIFYILTWVCWLLEWPVRGVDLLLCRLGFGDRRWIHLCVVVLERDRRKPQWSTSEIQRLLDGATTRLEQCNVSICFLHFEVVETAEHQTGIDCGVSMLFGSNYNWFRRYECRGFGAIVPITVFFVDDINDAKGCSVPGANFVLVDHEGTTATIAHEIGHISDLWAHSDDPLNVMASPTTDASVTFTKGQCCMIRSSKYATTVGACGTKQRQPLREKREG